MVKKLVVQLIIFVIGAIGYPIIELFYRAGHTHWTMILVGGFSFLAIIDVNCLLKEKSMFLRILIATLFVTAVEFIAGMIINKAFGMGVWDYADIEYNLEGQICLRYSFYWALLSATVIGVFELLTFFGNKLRNRKHK